MQKNSRWIYMYRLGTFSTFQPRLETSIKTPDLYKQGMLFFRFSEKSDLNFRFMKLPQEILTEMLGLNLKLFINTIDFVTFNAD